MAQTNFSKYEFMVLVNDEDTYLCTNSDEATRTFVSEIKAGHVAEIYALKNITREVTREFLYGSPTL